MTSPTIKTPFLITSRNFETDNQEQLAITLTKSYSDISTAVNLRQIGVYDSSQTNTGQRWFENGTLTGRLQAFRKVLTLPSVQSGDNLIPHGIAIDENTKFTHIYGTINKTNTDFRPLNYVDGTAGTDDIGLWVDTVNVHIVTTTANWTTYNAIVVLEYILNG